ncbi:MAG: metal ABC transporter substrate-binding protein [Methylobacteriaceae bacterium]|jgi:manganese/iron transport system substrate-binding protein|nr:metal ABC transporter substrate-binding protein [Methylobacteriaceae bacterium]
MLRELNRLVRAATLPGGLALFAACLPALAEPAPARLKVATTFTIIADMTRNVAGDAADVVCITKPGAEIHNYQPTPWDIRELAGAGLVLLNGFNLEAWFEKFYDNIEGVPRVVVTRGIEPVAINEGRLSGKPNPHAWLSLDAAAVYVDNIRDALAAEDPAHADLYRESAEGYKQRIRRELEPLIEDFAGLPEGRRWLVTSEGAFSYLTRDLGLKELYLWPINADQQGTPLQFKKVIDTIRAEHIPAVFSEISMSAEPAEQIARETGAEYAGELYVDSLTAADGPAPTYIELLKVTYSTILKGLAHDDR